MLTNDLKKFNGLFVTDAQTVIRAQFNNTRRAAMVGGNLTANTRQDASGVSARVFKNGVYGFSSMADMSDDAVKAVLKAASENAEFMDRRSNKGNFELPSVKTGELSTYKNINDPDQRFYIEVLKEPDEYIVKNCKNITNRAIIAYADMNEKITLSSDSYYAHSVSPRSYIYVNLFAQTPDGNPVELTVPVGKSGTFDENFPTAASVYDEVDKLYEQLMQKREGVYAEAGLRTCILGGILSGMLAHEAVGHTVEADLVLGGSVAAHNLNKPVASELVSMTDFANTAFGDEAPLPVYVDDEGTLCEDAPLIENGILTGYMHSRESALKLGCKPTGNARAYSYSDEPLIRMRNTAVHPGKDKLADMIASVENGYYLVGTGNGQADTTGEFMFGITMGYEIKKGKIGKAILDTTISGVAFDMLKTVDMVSDEMTWSSSGFCGKKQRMAVGMGGPALRCKLTMGGR